MPCPVRIARITDMGKGLITPFVAGDETVGMRCHLALQNYLY